MNTGQRYLLAGQEVDLNEWSKAETAKMRPLTETEKAHLRALLDMARPTSEKP